MKKIFAVPATAAFALMAGLSAPALAGGFVEPAPEPTIAPVAVAPAGTDWTGGYVGGRLGFGDGDVGGDEGDGVMYGLGAGYDYDFGNWVLGGLLNYDQSEIELDSGGEIENVMRLGLRAGPDLGRTLLYGTAGAAWADATVGGAGLSDNGWFAGVGLDYLLTDQWTIGGEILTHQFDDFDSTGLDVDATTAHLTANFRF